ncbi:response regulator transcription factor [Olsenella sp. Marseille-P4559]|uniref:response regulator transcription factor n=1 Tax=Olsenella sp. Marseille-P4559 TaxID=2364795 RepID=UPI00102FFA4B|nr:helix-turn-helix transcriptional regulator [Olsenella sp. Marseille-P4559]
MGGSSVAEGLSNAEIAEIMSIEPASVKRSVSRIISKLGLDSRVQVAVAWWRAGRF